MLKSSDDFLVELWGHFETFFELREAWDVLVDTNEVLDLGQLALCDLQPREVHLEVA